MLPVGDGGGGGGLLLACERYYENEISLIIKYSLDEAIVICINWIVCKIVTTIATPHARFGVTITRAHWANWTHSAPGPQADNNNNNKMN